MQIVANALLAFCVLTGVTFWILAILIGLYVAMNGRLSLEKEQYEDSVEMTLVYTPRSQTNSTTTIEEDES